MAWTTAGVQSGTDTSLSGLTTVTGTTTLAAGSALNLRTIYRVTDTTLVISGTLTMDPEHEEIIFPNDSTITISSGGIFNIGKAITINSVTRYSYGTAIHYSFGAGWSGGRLIVNSGGTLNWYGGIIYLGGHTLQYDAGSTVNLYSQNATLIRTQDAANAEAQIRISNTNYNQDGFTDVGYNDTEDWLTWIGFWTTFKGYKPIHKRSAMSGSSSSSTALYNNEDYDASGGCSDDNQFWYNRQMEYRNSVTGSNLLFTGLNASASTNRGVFMTTSDFTATILDDAQTGIVGAMYFIRDYNNGDRKNDNITGDLHNFVDDRTYVKTSTTGGVCTSTNVLTMAVVRNSGDLKGTADVGDNKYDYRSKNNNNADVFDIGFAAYGYLRAVASNLPLKGAGGVDYSQVMFDDINITELSQATVAGYTTLDDLNELYDYGSAWHLADAGGLNIEIPSLGEFLIPCAGNILNFGSKNVVINTGAASVFTFATNTVTIKPTTTLSVTSTKTTIQTTGTITFTTASIGDNLILDGNVILNAAQDLTDVTITGTLQINTGANSTLNFSNVTVGGNITNDDATHTLTINATDGSSLTAGDPGTGIGQTNIFTSVTVTVAIKNQSGDPIPGVEVAIFQANTARTVILASTATDENGEVSTPASASIGAVIIRARQSAKTTTFDTTSGVNEGTEVITTDAAHNFRDGDAVIYHTSTDAVDDINLIEGTTYYVNSITTTTLSLHTTASDAIADTGRVNLAAGTENEIHILDPIRYVATSATGSIGVTNFSTQITMVTDTIVSG